MNISKKQFAFLFTFFLIIGVTCILSFHSVDNSLTEEDMEYIPKYLNDVAPLPLNRTYGDEVTFIGSVQRSVLNVAPRHEGLPFGQKREPKQLYETRIGLCFDRSRVIEKILSYSGFKTRHVSLYSIEATQSGIRALFTREAPSHAVTEVLTRHGWLVVDSNVAWLSIDINGQPVSIDRIQSSAANSIRLRWRDDPPIDIYATPFTFVFGLYSRHGYFYPPYNAIPDINYAEFVQNAYFLSR